MEPTLVPLAKSTLKRVHVTPTTIRTVPGVPAGTPRRSMAATTLEPLRRMVSEFLAIARR